MTTQHLGTALITGGSTGIGAIYADRLARLGHDLILVARNGARLDDFAARLRLETGRKVETVAADLAEPARRVRVETILRTDESIDVLVNNAGVGAVEPLIDSDAERMQEMIAVNVAALVGLTQAAVPGMVARGSGKIINIASVAGVAPEMLNGVYGASKAFVIAFTQSLHHELAGRGVQVQAVLPGATATDFWRLSGRPVEELPQEIVMSAEDMVDAAIAGLFQGEVVTIPALPNAADWEAYEAARRALGPNLSRAEPATRYRAGAAAAARTRTRLRTTSMRIFHCSRSSDRLHRDVRCGRCRRPSADRSSRPRPRRRLRRRLLYVGARRLPRHRHPSRRWRLADACRGRARARRSGRAVLCRRARNRNARRRDHSSRRRVVHGTGCCLP